MVSPGKVNDGLLSQIDVYSTLATIVGADIPADSGEDSSNQLPFMVLLGI
jgi:arylsulfatase A